MGSTDRNDYFVKHCFAALTAQDTLFSYYPNFWKMQCAWDVLSTSLTPIGCLYMMCGFRLKFTNLSKLTHPHLHRLKHGSCAAQLWICTSSVCANCFDYVVVSWEQLDTRTVWTEHEPQQHCRKMRNAFLFLPFAVGFRSCYNSGLLVFARKYWCFSGHIPWFPPFSLVTICWNFVPFTFCSASWSLLSLSFWYLVNYLYY